MWLWPFLLSFCFVQAGEHFQFSDIPEGIPRGRVDATYGVYGSHFKRAARPYQAALDQLESKVYGFSQLAGDDEVTQAEASFYLENLILGVHRLIANAPARDLTAFERQSMLYRSAELYADLRTHSERLFEVMIRRVDVALPGASGVQGSIVGKDPLDRHYSSSYRSEKKLTLAEKQKFYLDKIAQFEKGGGSLAEMHVFTPEYFASLGSVSRFEYAERPNGELWVTPGNAGHLLLAGGGRALTAGQIIILKNAEGQASLVVITNGSGNFKPDLFSTSRLALRLADQLGLPSERVIVSKGEPLSTQTMRILQKARFVPSEQIKSRARAVEAEGERILNHPAAYLPMLPRKNCTDLLTETG